MKNRTFPDAKKQECDMWLRRRKGKNTCICISIKKQVRMTQVISYNRSSSQQENWNSEYLVCTEVLRLPQVSLEMQQPGWKIIHIVLKN